MDRAQAELAESLANEALRLQAGINSAAPDVGKALALFARAATVSLWASAAAENVQCLDDMVDLGFLLMRQAGRNTAYLFPAAPDLLNTMTFTAWCHLERFDYRLDVHDLDEANRHASNALELGDEDPIPEDIGIRAQTVIARTACRRFQIVGDVSLLDGAVTRLEAAVALQPDVTAMAALATCLRHRARVSELEAAQADLNRASGLLSSLANPETGPLPIPIYPVLRSQWIAELGLVHLAASELLANPAELERARELTSAAARIWPTSAALWAFAEVESAEQPYLQLIQRTKTRWSALQAAMQLARLAVSSGIVKEVIKPAQFACTLLDQVIERQVSDEARIPWLPLLAEMTGIVVPALVAGGNIGSAVKCVEHVRTRVLQEHFPDEDRELFELGMAGHQDLSGPIRHALDTMRSSHGSSQSRSLARDELSRYVDQVRQLPGFDSFRTSVGTEEICAGIDAPLVYLVPGQPAGVALVLLPDGSPPVSIRLPGCPVVPPVAVERFRTAAFSAALPAGARRRAIEAVSAWAWDAIYEPLREVLVGHSYAHIIGASYLALVPCHAARTRSSTGWRYAFEDIELRYVPSARVLAAVRRRQVPAKEPGFLVIPQLIGAGSSLEGARTEVNEVASYFQSATILGQEDITTHGIRRAIGSVGWLHAACHGFADPEDPLASGLVLGQGERFTLRDLFEANQGHLLVAVLSACQTNVPDLRLPDEATSLATGLLMGGCRAVIASAWQVPDSATSALMQLFYRQWRHIGNDVPCALRQAQLQFATGGAADLKEWRPEWTEPYFWAGFSYLGP
jgi:CHAT domain